MKRIFLFIAFSIAICQTSATVRFAGSLTEADGTAVDGTKTIEFSIYDTETGGTSLWSSTRTVGLTAGQFEIDLGEVTPLHLSFDGDYYVEMTVEGEILSPRYALPQSAYSRRAEFATRAVQSVSSSEDHTGRTGHLRFVPLDGTEITESMSDGADTIYIAIGSTGGTSPGSGSLTPAQLFLAQEIGTVTGPTWDTICVVEPYSAGDYIIPINMKLEYRRTSYSGGQAKMRYTIYYYDGDVYTSPEYSTYNTSYETIIDTPVPFHSSYLIAFSKIVVEAWNGNDGYVTQAQLIVSGYEIEP